MGYAVRQDSGAGVTVDCEPNVELNDYVYLSAVSEKAGKARADSINTMPAVGKVTRKLSNNRCIINQFILEKTSLDLHLKRDSLYLLRMQDR